MITLQNYTPEPNTGCWLWLGAVQSSGYGNTSKGLAHRVMYEQEVGLIPAGAQVQHKCGVKICINPTHLKTGTQSANEVDKIRHGTARYYAQYGPRGYRNGKFVLITSEER